MRGVLVFTGLGLCGYGGLVLLGLLAHESTTTGLAALSLGAGTLLLSSRATHRDAGVEGATAGASGDPGQAGVPRGARLAVATVGLGAVLGVLLYNAVRDSALALPEWGIVGYGVALLAAAPWMGRRLGRVGVGTLVMWSIPLLLVPLAMYALDAALAGGGSPMAQPVIHALLVVPTAQALAWIGTPVHIVDNNLILPTARGTLVLGVGLVCAGLYPMAAFTGLVAVHGWKERLPARRLAAYTVAGLVGLWLINILRLLALAKVGQHKGAGALQTAHANLGWLFFVVFLAGFWAIIAHVVEPRLARCAGRASDDV